jgi:hypothetical protein
VSFDEHRIAGAGDGAGFCSSGWGAGRKIRAPRDSKGSFADPDDETPRSRSSDSVLGKLSV